MEIIVGIDFGTTNSEVACFRWGKAAIIPNPQGERIIPSAVFIDEQGRRFVGQAARNVVVLHPERTVRSVKRELGRRTPYHIGGQTYEPEQIAAFILAELKGMAESSLGQPVSKAVITVPAYFDDPKRQAVKQAATLAGLEVVRLVNEPTAAALAYGVDSQEKGNILVYDLGGGTFDVSVLQAGDGVFQVLATRGDARLGGDDFDREIAELLLERFKEESGIDLKEDRLALQKVYQEAERAKIALSVSTSVQVEIPFIAASCQGPCHLETLLTRAELEELILRHLDRTLRLTKGALKDAGLSPRDVDAVLLVGGSTRIPAVRKAVEDLFGRPARAGVNPEEVVACGAAIQAGILAGEAQRTVLVDVTPLGLGVETVDEKAVQLVPRNSALPAQATALFTTVADYQSAAQINVLQGERSRAGDNILLGSFRLENIQMARQGQPDIEVCFQIDAEGIVHVSARDLVTGSSEAIALDGSRHLTPERIQGIIAESAAAELEDAYATS